MTAASVTAVRYACALARSLRIRLELLHVVPEDATPAAVDRAYRTLHLSVPPDLGEEVSSHVRRGDPRTEIPSYAAITEPTFVMLGGHARGFVRHFFTPDTTQAVVRRLECPAWVIPASVTA
jgi:nucleotide-binding universal stress UspA family protein